MGWDKAAAKSTAWIFISCTSGPPDANAMPLLMTHGWTGSVLEFRLVIEPLVNPTAHGDTADDAFHLVIPDLPLNFHPAGTGALWVDRPICAGGATDIR
ncbi:epoxide hydrolase N-terminal domain-containing protein, partial [Loktanella sp. SALINAS62]|uniref:epoxide hydrolase N-terminal domain-containing protein n=1 Tax=Loktanella sp. SALINAS62 TaxID=2706124 RepID=UPI002012E2BD